MPDPAALSARLDAMERALAELPSARRRPVEAALGDMVAAIRVLLAREQDLLRQLAAARSECHDLREELSIVVEHLRQLGRTTHPN